MKILGKIIQSQSDKRAFRAIELKNRLQCLIISDSEAQKSSAALSVGVGSLKDPLQAQGLAHYLEHMLFMGTEKYPDQNDYSNFIAKNSGYSNAYTSQEETNFHFEVSTNAFSETLDRFAQFFIAPLMSDSSSERELNAVNSEHSKNLQNDLWRKYQLSKHLAKENHPLKKFSTGDKNSLSNPNLRKMLHDFYGQNYSSNLMKMVVYGKQNLDQLSKTVENKFSDIPNHNYSKFKVMEQPYEFQTFQNIYKINPVKDRKNLQLEWIISNQSSNYENHPGMYVSHMFGHEGKGSLLSFLVSEGLATSIGSSYQDNFNCYTEFSVSFALTKKGVENINLIIQYTLYYLNMLKEKGPQEWVFREIQDLNKMRFDYMEKSQGMSFVSKLAKRLQNRKVEEVMAYPYFMKEWKQELIVNFLEQLTPQNLIVFAEAKQFSKECDLIEPIYKTQFLKQPLSLKARKCEIDLPEQNMFLPDSLQTLSLGLKQEPQKIFQSEKMAIFWKKDHRFELPKISTSFRIYYEGNNNAKEDICSSFYFSMMKENLREFVYLAETAGINVSISDSSYFTFDIHVGGFRSSVEKFLLPFFNKFIQFQPQDEKYFIDLKENMERFYANYFLSDPYRLAYNSIFMALREGGGSSPSEKLRLVKSITLEDIQDFGQQWRQKIYIESLINGNIQQESAMKICENLQEFFAPQIKLEKGSIPSIRAIKLPPDTIWSVYEELKSQDEENSALIVHYQYGAFDLKSSVLQDLCLSFVKEPAFDYLRTKQQLGYIVMCLPDDHRGVLGLSVLVQSQVKCTFELVEYVDTFIKRILLEKVQKLDEKTFEDYKNSLKEVKKQKDKNLISESSRLWMQIIRHQFEFNRKQKQLKVLEEISLSDFKSFLNMLFYLSPRRFQMHISSNKHNQKNKELRSEHLKKNKNYAMFCDIETFRKKMSLYPDFYSHL